MTFRNDILAGNTLVREAIQSENYQAGVSGWQIAADGSAEFSDVVLRGDGVGDTVEIGPDDGSQVLIGYDGSFSYLRFPMHSPKEFAASSIFGAVFNEGLPNENLSLQFLGPKTTPSTDNVVLTLSSQNADGTSDANLQITGTSGVLLSVSKNGFDFNRHGRIDPTSTTNTALIINAPAAMTGNLLSLQVNGNTKLDIDEEGVITEYADNAFTTYTPTVNGGGAATFTTRTGWYQRLGKMIFFNATVIVGVAGSGAGLVQITAPTAISRVTRQTVLVNGQGLTAGNNGSCSLLAFSGGAGATFDRLRNSNGTADVVGADLLAGATLTVCGWYREA
jgi:hypothetical protein